MSKALEILLFGVYVCLLYKQAEVGIALLALVAILGFCHSFRARYVWSALPFFSLAYAFMTLVTAFLWSTEQGLYRTSQFLLLSAAAIATTNYFHIISHEQRQAFIRRFLFLNLIIFAHMALYHLSTDRIWTWKYLYDTKTTLSVVPLLIFIYEDALKKRFGNPGWFLLLGGLAMPILLSGERKAYVLFGVLFILSRTPLLYKGMAAGVVGVGMMLYASSAATDNYVVRQLQSLISSEREMEISEFYAIENIADQSNLIREFVGRMAWEQFLANPILGLGATGYQSWSRETFGTQTATAGLSMNVHGEISRVPVEGGVVGIVIATIYLILLTRAVWLHVIEKGGAASSKGRAPLYIYCFLVLYCSYEAMDTLMIAMIVMFGLEMSRLNSYIRRRWRPAPMRRTAAPRGLRRSSA